MGGMHAHIAAGRLFAIASRLKISWARPGYRLSWKYRFAHFKESIKMNLFNKRLLWKQKKLTDLHANASIKNIDKYFLWIVEDR